MSFEQWFKEEMGYEYDHNEWENPVPLRLLEAAYVAGYNKAVDDAWASSK